MNDWTTDKFNRVEVIDKTGRAFQGHNIANVRFSMQDNGQTLKIFILEKEE